MQLAGDLLTVDSSGESRADGIIATGYLAIARRFGHDIDKDMYLTHEDVIDNLGKNFLGLSLGCARCHDHKYDPVSSQDYYALYGIFESTKFAFPGCEPQGQPRDLVPLISQAQVDARCDPGRSRARRWRPRNNGDRRPHSRPRSRSGRSGRRPNECSLQSSWAKGRQSLRAEIPRAPW